jgi:cytidylate kinase
VAVVTISNEVGSQGSAIGKAAAQALGYHFADQATLETLLKDYGLVQFEEEYHSIPGFWDRFDPNKQARRETFLRMLDQAFQALAQHGDIVIVGRVGFAILAGLADVLKVRVQAPLELRIERTEAAPSVAEPNPPSGVVREYDELQKDFVESVYGVPWDASKSFDLVIDTGKIAPELAANMIAQAAGALKVTKGKRTSTAAELEVDKILVSAVQEILGCRSGH